MICKVMYTVPVEVEVDTDAGTITKVTVYNEDVKATNEPVTTDVDLGTACVPDAEPAARIARALAEHESWPVWDNG